MSDTASVRWHVSDVHVSGHRAAATPEPTPSATIPGTPTPAPTAQTLAPLWYRIVSGQAFGWRIRRVRNRIRWARRAMARRTLRWLRLHPEIAEAAHHGTLRHLVVTAVRERGRRRTEAHHRYRPRVAITNEVTIEPTLQHRFDAVDLVDVTNLGGAHVTVQSDGDDGLVTIAGPDGRRDRVPAPVDLARWNPSTFQQRPSGAAVDLEEVLATTHTPRNRVLRAQRARAVTCNHTGALSASTAADTIIELATAGVALAGTIPEATADLLGSRLAGEVAASTVDDLAEDRDRELHSLRIRRAAMERYSPRGWWQTVGAECGAAVDATPRISVLLPSNRADDIVGAARLVAHQVDVDVQLVVGLHGRHMPAALDADLAEAFGGELVICRCDDERNLGEVMNTLTAAADRDLVSKWDDDDWYDTHHLADLVRALEYSGAALVGKAAEFVYLETLDITVRRFATGSERASTTIAGGTLLMTRDELDEVGWAEVPRQVDRRLIDALQERGRGIYRTHGFGYVLRRRSSALSAHTWLAGDDYFLRQSTGQQPGLDLAFAGFEMAT